MKKTFYKESTKMPLPTSYIDVMQSGTRRSEKTQWTSNKKGYYYNYINALKKYVYKVERLNIR